MSGPYPGRRDNFDVSWDTEPLKAVKRYLGATTKEVDKAVRQSNGVWAKKLRDLIRQAAPSEGSHVKHRRKKGSKGPKHDTRPGATKRAIVSRTSMYSPSVIARSSKTPHFMVQEFGGAVWWRSRSRGGMAYHAAAGRQRRNDTSHVSQAKLRGRSKTGHIIHVRDRAPTMGSLGLNMGKFDKGASSGYFFWPTVRKHIHDIYDSAIHGQQDAIRRTLPRRIA